MADMDIDMDLDLGPLPEEEHIVQEVQTIAPEPAVQIDPDIPEAYTDQTLNIQPDKVHIRGLDETTTEEIRAFSKEHFTLADPKKVEWIDDTSANLIYGSKELATKALEALTLDPSNPAIADNPLELRVAKSMPSRPQSMLQIRAALFSDKKERGAYDRSRFYLMHPEHDPRERMRIERQRRGEPGDYRRRRYDDQEHRRRRDKEDENMDFDASMYDDDGGAQNNKQQRNRSASPGEYSDTNSNSRSRFRSRRSPPLRRRENNAKKELFPTTTTTTTSNTTLSNGALNGSISLLSLERDAPPQIPTRELYPAQTAVNKSIARNLKRELFPNRTDRSNHRRTDAFDATATTSPTSAATPVRELFPTDGTGGGGGLSILGSSGPGLSIKGNAGISIKGRGGTGRDTRELVPESYDESLRRNEGKELFGDVLEGRGVRGRGRKRAEDMFG